MGIANGGAERMLAKAAITAANVKTLFIFSIIKIISIELDITKIVFSNTIKFFIKLNFRVLIYHLKYHCI